ncbi:MAG: glycosyltransferase [Candidatus Thorarchaeota archaeon]
MIFVTVGTAQFDELVMEVDGLVRSGVIRDRVVAQIGRGRYVPTSIEYFRLARSLNSAYDHADVIVSAGGAGTIMECVRRGLRLVVVENRSLMEGHQAQLVREMARRGHLLWCPSVSEIAEYVERARHMRFEPFVSDPPRAHLLIRDLLRRPR